MAGRIVILNGAPRSGKSSLAAAVRDRVPGRWIVFGVDAFNASLPPALLPGIGLRPGGERPDLEADVRRLYAAYFSFLAELSTQGYDVVADLGLHADYAEPFDPFVMMQARFAGLPLFLVGIRCDLETILLRRSQDSDRRHVPLGAEAPAPVRRWQALHQGRCYDLELDMGRLTPEAGATLLAELLSSHGM